MHASSWKKATEQIAQQKVVTHQIQPAATTDSNQLATLLLSALSVDGSGPPVVHHGIHLPLAASTPRETSTPTDEQQTNSAYQQIIPGVSQRLYPTITSDGAIGVAQANNGPTLDD